MVRSSPVRAPSRMGSAFVAVVVASFVLSGCITSAPEGEPRPPAGTEGGPEVRVERCGGQWCAEATYSWTGTVRDAVTVDLDTFNGRVTVNGAARDQTASVELEVWARAGSASAARAALQDITVHQALRDDEVVAVARGPQTPDSIARGAHIDAVIPATLEGVIDSSNGRIALGSLRVDDLDVDTSNGRIDLNDVRGRDLRLDTSNGAIEGDVRIRGDFEADTSNGAIELEIRPTGDTRMAVDSSNGAIELDLVEAGDISYLLRATTSNSDITETMAEARLEGEEDDATLRTDGDERDISVTGRVDTSNGAIRFQGA